MMQKSLYDADACRNHMMLMHAEVIIHNTKVMYNVCTVKSFLQVISHSTSSGQWTRFSINILISSGMGAQIGKHANVVTSSC